MKLLIKVLAFGCGVQTMSELLDNYKGYDYVVMSDTGDEKPETYDYLYNYVLPFVREKNIKFVVVKNNKYISLYDYCIQHKQVPMRNFRLCTFKFKKYPLNKFCKSLGATRKNPVIKALGISLDESDRVNEFQSQSKEPKYIKLEYPLLDRKITREKCKEIIKSYGFPVPVKSGCWYCPFARKEEWRRLKIDKPFLFKQAVFLEQNNAKYPKRTIKFTKPLDQINFNFSLDDFEELESCDSGHCMT